MANLRNIQFLRSTTLYNNLAAAKAALSAQASNLRDGSPIIGRYKFGTEEDYEIKSLIGIAHVGFNGATGVTFFESADDVAQAIQQLQDEMDATQTAIGTASGGTHVQSSSHFTSAATTVEEEIALLAAALEALNYVKTVGDSEVFSTITETEGKVSATTKNLTTVKLAGYAVGGDDSGKVAETDTLGAALGKLQGQINGMDKAASAVDGQVVTTITETDGKVSETKANVKDLQLGGYAKTNDTGDIGATDTVNVALSKLENKAAAITIGNDDASVNVTTASSGTNINVNIKSGEHVLAKDGNEGIYTNIAISAVTGSELTGLGTNVKEAYKLVGTDNTQLGEYVKIYKDSALKEIYLGSSADTIDATTGVITKVQVTDPQSLNYAYQLADGTYTLVKVDVSKFLVESEFASGVTQNGAGVVTGVVDANSESVITAYSQDGNTSAKVLSVGADGFRVDNIQNAITAAVGRAQTSINTAVTSSDERTTHLTIAETVADNGSKSYAFTTNDIASEDELDAEVTRAKAAEAAFDGILGSVKGDNTETRTWTKSGVHYVGSGVTVKDDIVTLDSQVFELSGQTQTIAVAVNDLDDRVVELSGKTVTDFTSDNNSISVSTAATANGTVTVDLGTNASKISGLTAVADADEGAAKVSGVTATDSVQTGIKRLYDSLKSEIAARKAAIAARTIASANKGITVTETPNADGFGTTLTLTLDETKNGSGEERTGNDNALEITNGGLFLSRDWNCGTF